MLLGDGRDRGLDELELVAVHQTVARVVRLAEEQVRVELDRVHAQAELGDHVDEHGRLLLPRAGQAQPVAVPLVGSKNQLFRREILGAGNRRRQRLMRAG